MAKKKCGERSRVMFRSAQTGLFDGDLNSRLGEDSVAVWLLGTLQRLDLSSLEALFQDNGGFPYHPRTLLGVVLLGGIVRRTSSRDLEDACLYDVRFSHVAGNQTPDYRTIARFRKRIAPVMDDIFKQVVRLAMEDGLVQLGRVSLDSTKVASAASRFTREMRKNMDEEGEEDSSDPEAVILRTRKGYVRGYCVQAAVDADTGIVVAADLTLDRTDRGAGPPMLKKIEETTGCLPGEVLADTGYDTHATFAAFDEAGVEVHIPPANPDGGFWFVDEGHRALCPMGHPALPLKAKMYRGVYVQPYRVRKCLTCMFKTTCSPKGHGRQLEAPFGVDPSLRLLAMRKADTLEGRLAAHKRMATIEPVFGDLKWNQKKARLSTRGLIQAKAEILTQLAAKNLKRMFRGSKMPCFAVFEAQSLCKTRNCFDIQPRTARAA